MRVTRNGTAVLLFAFLFGGNALAAEYYSRVSKLPELAPDKALAASAVLLRKPRCQSDEWCRCETLKARANAARDATDDAVLQDALKQYAGNRCHIRKGHLEGATVSRLMKSGQGGLALELGKADFMRAPSSSHYYLSLLRDMGESKEVFRALGFVNEVVAPVSAFSASFMQRMAAINPSTPEDLDRYAQVYEEAVSYFRKAADAAKVGKCKNSIQYCEVYFSGLGSDFLEQAAMHRQNASRLRQRAADAARNAETYSAIGGFFGALVGVGGDYGQVANLGAQVSNAIASEAQTSVSELANMQNAISADEFQALLSALR